MSSPPQLLPRDSYNRELLAQVHPEDWRNPVPPGKYNLVVIGGGTAGLVAAAGAAGLGARVALVERHLMGGDCLNFGCVPSKTLIRAARQAAAMRRGEEFGVSAGTVEVDFGRVMERLRKMRAGISRHDSVKRFTSLGIDVFLGAAAFTGQDTVSVDGVELRYHRAVIATGARAATPAVAGLDEVPWLTNETIFSLTELPRRLAVLGAGPVGCELAQSFARLGSEVFLVETGEGILPKEDRDAAKLVRQQMERDGVKVFSGGREVKVSAGREGTVRLTGPKGDGCYEIEADRLLVAAGRAPNVEGLNLEAAGVEYDRKAVKVDERLRTSNRKIYAAGDICSRYQFTHAADFMARIVIQNALFFGRKKVGGLIIPWATYTSPEVAHVGLYENEAAERGVEVFTLTQPMSEVDRAVLDGAASGFVRVHLKKGTDRILGATIVSEHAGELISVITMAMTKGIGLGKIAGTIFPYPTQAEAIRKVADQYNRTRLTPPVKKLFTRLLAWRRGG